MRQIQITGNFLTILNQIKKRTLTLINQIFLEKEDLEIDWFFYFILMF